MNVIIDGKWMVPISVIGAVEAVEPIGSSYDPTGYAVSGTPKSSDMLIVGDDKINRGEAADEAKNAQAASDLEVAKKENKKLTLHVKRAEAVDRLAPELRGISRAEVKRWSESVEYWRSLHSVQPAMVRQWLKDNPRKD